jgi:CRISPR-associated protein Cas2
MKKFIVIAYDISSDKRRKKVHDLLKDYGMSINLSVFECFVSEANLKKIKLQINKLISKKDIVVYYYICLECYSKSERINFKYPNTDSVLTV